MKASGPSLLCLRSRLQKMTTRVSMKTAAEYRVMAEKCFRWARNTYMDEMHETYLQLAQFWLDVASKLDARKL